MRIGELARQSGVPATALRYYEQLGVPPAPRRADSGYRMRTLQLRWAVQADYFAPRIATNDLTGIEGPEENEEGLNDGRRAIGR